MKSQDLKQQILESYQAFCRERVYVCAYCDHCLDEPEIENWLSQALDKYAEGKLREIREVISTHDEGDGYYCDTGGDMEWGCRSECMSKALERLDRTFPAPEKIKEHYEGRKGNFLD